MTSCSALIKVAASFLFWAVIGIEGAHDSCFMEASITCQVPGDGWKDCKDIKYNPVKKCEEIPVSYKFEACNTAPATGAARFQDFTTTVKQWEKTHRKAKRVTLAPPTATGVEECAYTRMPSSINTCTDRSHWAKFKTKSKTASGVVCKGYAFWQYTVPPKRTFPPTTTPTFKFPCGLKVNLTCNRRDKAGWPNCRDMTTTGPGTCGKVPVLMRAEVCNFNADTVQIVRGITSVNGKEWQMKNRFKVPVLPTQCSYVKVFDMIDTCEREDQVAWANIHGVTSTGRQCVGFDKWEQTIPYITNAPTVVPLSTLP